MTPEATEAATLQVNKLARRNRQLKIFSKSTLVKSYLFRVLSLALTPVKVAGKAVRSSKVGRFLFDLWSSLFDFIPVSPQKRLLFQAVLISSAALVVTSVTPGGTFTSAAMSYSYDYISEYYFAGDIVVDADGYLVKMNPQTDHSSRIGLTDYAVHTVESGETLSVIAVKYDLNTSTIMWENNIVNANSLRVGQKLIIPPVDGISYTVKSGETLDKIASKYEISSEGIIAQNSLESETLSQGQSLFLPGAEPLNSPTIAADGSRASTVTRSSRTSSYTYENTSSSTSTPAVGRIFIYPTSGIITQGYHAGHYAIDIADSSMPPVWAAGGGTVSKVSVGTWGGGYGNHIIIDHGNGLQTLYAHLDSVNVYEGQWVNQGDVIGIMGNTGRVYGVTGIHLHWEVIQDGVKQYPGNYY